MSSLWDENGTVIVEYGLVLALLSVGFIAGMIAIASRLLAIPTSAAKSPMRNCKLRISGRLGASAPPANAIQLARITSQAHRLKPRMGLLPT